MLTRTSIAVILIIAIVVWGTFLWGLGIELTWEHAKPYSLTLTVLTFAWWLFNKFFWKLWPCNIFAHLPDLGGTWLAELQSSYQDPKTGQRVGPVEGYAVIRQTFTTLSIRLMTPDTESFLVAYSFDRHPDGTTYIYGAYQSDPSILLRSKVSEIHYGSFKYKVIGSPAMEIAGHYWTDRHTNGSVRFHNHNKQLFDSYNSAKEKM